MLKRVRNVTGIGILMAARDMLLLLYIIQCVFVPSFQSEVC